jgi:hypothetical protein
VLKKHKKVYKNNNVKVISLDAIFPDIIPITNGKKNMSEEKERDIQSMLPDMPQIGKKFYSVTVLK